MSDQFVACITAGRTQDAYAKMEEAYRKLSSEDSFETNLQKLLTPCGRPERLAYLYCLSGVTAEYNGAVKPYRKYYYGFSSRTDPSGRCYIAVEVVPDGDRLAVSTFLCGRN